MKKKLKRYIAEFDEASSSGVYGISLVENPAMQGMFIALSEQKEVLLKEVDKEQRILMGLVLEPNKQIYRNDNGAEYTIEFDENTIKELAHNFFKKNFQKNSTIEHDNDTKLSDVTFVESWIVEDSEKDKSANFGFSYPKGSWMATLKVDNNDVWSDFVKTGKIKGFSIDAMLNLKEINFKSEINMSNEILEETKKGNSLIENLMLKLGLNKEPEVVVKLGMVKSKDETVSFQFEGEELKEGILIWVETPDGEEKIPLPIGEYETEDDKIVVVLEEGLIDEVKSIEIEIEEDKPMETEMAKPNTDSQAEAIANAVKSVLIKYTDEANLKFEALEKKILELSDQPASKPIKATPSQAGVKLSLQERINNKL